MVKDTGEPKKLGVPKSHGPWDVTDLNASFDQKPSSFMLT